MTGSPFRLIGRMFALWAWERKPYAPAFQTLTDYAAENEGFFPDIAFIEEKLKKSLETMDEREKMRLSEEDIRDYYSIVLMWLNQEFLRVRYGALQERLSFLLKR